MPDNRKAVLALEEKDFKRHKDVVAYFNQAYIATEVFSKELGRLQQKREKSDYDDFYVASKDEAEEQIVYAKEIIGAVKNIWIQKIKIRAIYE